MSPSKSPQVMGPVPSLEVATLPKLMPNGTNWVTFKRRMMIDIKARAHLIRHLEGRAPHPKVPAPLKGKPTQQEEDEYEVVISRPGLWAGSQPKPAVGSRAGLEPGRWPRVAYGPGFKFGELPSPALAQALAVGRP